MDHGLDINRPRRVMLYFLTELVNNTDNRMVTCLTVHLPDRFKNLLLAEHPSKIFLEFWKKSPIPIGILSVPEKNSKHRQCIYTAVILPGQLRRKNVFWGISPDPYHTEREVALIANRTRNNPAFLWLTEDEKALIYQKMRQAGTDNFSAYCAI